MRAVNRLAGIATKPVKKHTCLIAQRTNSHEEINNSSDPNVLHDDNYGRTNWFSEDHDGHQYHINRVS